MTRSSEPFLRDVNAQSWKRPWLIWDLNFGPLDQQSVMKPLYYLGCTHKGELLRQSNLTWYKLSIKTYLLFHNTDTHFHIRNLTFAKNTTTTDSNANFILLFLIFFSQRRYTIQKIALTEIFNESKLQFMWFQKHKTIW
jgi:hypothetical protein